MADDAALRRLEAFLLTRGQSQEFDYSWSCFDSERVSRHCEPPPLLRNAAVSSALTISDNYFAAVLLVDRAMALLINRAASQRRIDFIGRAIWATSLVVDRSGSPLLLKVGSSLTRVVASELLDALICDEQGGDYQVAPAALSEELRRIAASAVSPRVSIGSVGAHSARILLVRGASQRSIHLCTPPSPLTDLRRLSQRAGAIDDNESRSHLDSKSPLRRRTGRAER